MGDDDVAADGVVNVDRLGFPEEEIVNLKSKLYEIKLTLRQLKALETLKKKNINFSS